MYTYREPLSEYLQRYWRVLQHVLKSYAILCLAYLTPAMLKTVVKVDLTEGQIAILRDLAQQRGMTFDECLSKVFLYGLIKTFETMTGTTSDVKF